ncbi:MAG: hypothetical protein PHQ75_06330, partial [Thermoguttaceae bacterium]|nr:hypothetical protein [Thermoguttaceae bacterium]
MQKIMKTFCLLVSMLVLFQVTPAKADLVCDAIRSACRQAGVSEWIKKEINGGQLLVNPFTAGEGVRGMSEISIFRTELLNDLQNAGITIYSPLTATAPANTLKGEISILRSRASLTSKLVLTLGKSATKEVVVKDQGVAAVLAGTTIVTEGQDGKDLIVEQNDAVNSSGVRMSQGEAGTAINDTTLPGSPYEVAVLGKDGQ